VRRARYGAAEAVRNAARFSRERFRESFLEALRGALEAAGRPDLAAEAARRTEAGSRRILSAGTP